MTLRALNLFPVGLLVAVAVQFTGCTPVEYERGSRIADALEHEALVAGQSGRGRSASGLLITALGLRVVQAFLPPQRPAAPPAPPPVAQPAAQPAPPPVAQPAAQPAPPPVAQPAAQPAAPLADIACPRCGNRGQAPLGMQVRCGGCNLALVVQAQAVAAK